MVDATSPDGIALWTNADPVSLVQESQTQGATIQAALNKRERYDFVWANSSERTSQTGMVQGSRGYQIDTKSEYIYDNSAWRLALPYAEFTMAAKIIPTAVYTTMSPLVYQSAPSTSATMITASPTSGAFVIVDPGVYGFSIYAQEAGGAAITGQSHIVVADTVTGTNTQYTRGYFTGGQSAMAPMPFFRTTTANTTIYILAYQDTGSNKNINGTLRIGRFG